MRGHSARFLLSRGDLSFVDRWSLRHISHPLLPVAVQAGKVSHSPILRGIYSPVILRRQKLKTMFTPTASAFGTALLPPGLTRY
jgi:hypothetical protein